MRLSNLFMCPDKMDHYRETGKVDPDYESYNSALELNEEEDKKENLNKLRKIVDEEYSKEIIQRQEQIEKIELQICKVRKVLHLLRYALTVSYYKKPELEYNATEEETPSDSLIVPDKQNRIHPAVKKLLGKNVQNLDHLNIRDKRKTNARNNFSSKVLETSTDSPESKKIKLDVEISQIADLPESKLKFDFVSQIDRTVAQVQNVKQETSVDFIRSRKKVKYRIIVGNISKWTPSSENDSLTHKWMLYIRGPKDKPDVLHLIDKVVYHLHPSYKPYDVVEVSESPFHLSRRGWGEFPVRVKIYFKQNKPHEVIHNIKLDKTYSGRQTLGSETLVDVFLYDDNQHNLEAIEIVASEESDIKIEECDIKIEETEMAEAPSTSIEHDYCSGLQIDDQIDHSYSLPSSQEGLPKPKKEKIEQDETNKLIYGLDTYCREQNVEDKNKCIITANHFKQLLQLNRKDIKFNNTKIIVFGKNIEGSLLTKFGKLVQTSSRDVVSTNRTQENSIRVTLPKNRFKNMGEALPYLFKRLPLYSELANNINYKRMYPFTASSLKEFVSWNVGKRRSSEWSRARIITNLLLTEKVHGIQNWTTKAILMYGRSHDYTPFISYGLFTRESEEKSLLMTSYSDSCQLTRSSYNKVIVEDEPDVTVNVDSDSETSPKKIRPVIDISDPHKWMECSYIRQTALDDGIILKSEEIIDGVKVNGAEMMILEAVKCLANNLIRRAKNHRICTKNLSSNTSAINKDDVEVAINERPELFCLRQFRSERRNDYFP